MNITEQLQHKIDTKTKPLGSLGKLEKLALQIGKIQNTTSPELKNPVILVFAADHGLASEGVSVFPREVTAQMVLNFLAGGAAINVFCKQNDIDLKVIDAGVDFDFPDNGNLISAKIGRGTKNMMLEPAMSVEECSQAIEQGKKIVDSIYEKGSNVIGFGEMGIGNTSAAALLMHRFCKLPLARCVGRGTGHDEAGLNKKLNTLEKVVEKYTSVDEPIEVLATFGGFEIAMMVGSMIKATELGMILLIDGFIVTSALLSAFNLSPEVIENCIFCHQSDEQGHKLMLDQLDAVPVLDLNMRLGEGSGAAIAYPVIKGAVSFLNEMASFEDAGVSNKE